MRNTKGLTSFLLGIQLLREGRSFGCEAPVTSCSHPFHRSQTHASDMFESVTYFSASLLFLLISLPGARLPECFSKVPALSILVSVDSSVFKTSLPFEFLAVYCLYSSNPGITNLHWKYSVSLPCLHVLEFSPESGVYESQNSDPRGEETVVDSSLTNTYPEARNMSSS